MKIVGARIVENTIGTLRINVYDSKPKRFYTGVPNALNIKNTRTLQSKHDKTKCFQIPSISITKIKSISLRLCFKNPVLLKAQHSILLGRKTVQRKHVLTSESRNKAGYTSATIEGVNSAESLRRSVSRYVGVRLGPIGEYRRVDCDL